MIEAPADGAPFDQLTLTDLRSRQSSKWRDIAEDELPAWVAESDFPLAPAVERALATAIQLGDTGYSSGASQDLAHAFVGFAARHWAWPVDPNDVLPIPDATAGLEQVIRRVTHPGDRIAMFAPAYQPFFEVVSETELELVRLRFRAAPTSWEIDFDELTTVLGSGVHVLLLNNPHNPTGKVFDAQELRRIAEIAHAHNVFVVSDEVSAPLTLGRPHVPWLSVDHPAATNSATVIGATKAFNIAGLKSSLLITSGTSRRIAQDLPAEFPAMTGHLGVLASTAAFTDGDRWLAAQQDHLIRNRAVMAEWLDAAPELRWIPPQAGYLAWVDCRATALGDAPARTLRERTGLVVVEGSEFDASTGTGWIRVNFGTGRAILTEILRRIDVTLGAT